jgi:hypothetical protein
MQDSSSPSRHGGLAFPSRIALVCRRPPPLRQNLHVGWDPPPVVHGVGRPIVLCGQISPPCQSSSSSSPVPLRGFGLLETKLAFPALGGIHQVVVDGKKMTTLFRGVCRIHDVSEVESGPKPKRGCVVWAKSRVGIRKSTFISRFAFFVGIIL